MTSDEGRRGGWWRSPNVLVPVVGLLYFALLFSLLTIQTLLSTGRIEFFELLYLPFVIGSFVHWRSLAQGFFPWGTRLLLSLLRCERLWCVTGCGAETERLDRTCSRTLPARRVLSRITFYPALLAVRSIPFWIPRVLPTTPGTDQVSSASGIPHPASWRCLFSDS